MDWLEVAFKIFFVLFGLFAIGRLFDRDGMAQISGAQQWNRRMRGTPLSKPVKIYYLADHDGVPFYAGKTNRSLEQRHKEHCEDAKQWGSPKQRYIWLMQQINQRPTIHHITTVNTTEEDVDNAERQAIAQFGVTNVVIP